MVKRGFKEGINHWHNVIAPNSFRKRMAKRLVKQAKASHGDKMGAVYLVGSTASRRAMQHSSINLIFIWKPGIGDVKTLNGDVHTIARRMDQLGKKPNGWYYSIRGVTADKIHTAEGLMQPEMEILHGKHFAREEGLPLRLKSKEKKKQYTRIPKSEVDVSESNRGRFKDPMARRRGPVGILERLKIEKESK